jgi:predicted amino acid racemase
VNRVIIDLEALAHNLEVVQRWTAAHGAGLTVVTKALCGHEATIRALLDLGVTSLADSRLENLRAVDRRDGVPELWYLRPPHRSALAEVVALSDVSLNTELEVVRALDTAAGRQGRCHGVVLMIELGDLREGVLPGHLVKVYEEVFKLPNVEVVGIGANLGCLSGAVPSIDEIMQLVLYRELLELKFERRLPLISAGTSAVLPLLLDGVLPKAVNHFRIGETILLGTDPVSGEVMRGLRGDVFTIEAEVVEVKEKSLVPLTETTEMTPFAAIQGDAEVVPGQRGYRAVVTLGQVDTEVASLQPVNPNHRVAGASSDITVVNLGDEPSGIRVGDTLQFRPGYAALVRLMNNPYAEKRVFSGSADTPDADPGGKVNASRKPPTEPVGLDT